MHGYTDGERRMFDAWLGGTPGEAGDHRQALGMPAHPADDLVLGVKVGPAREPAVDTRLPSHGRHYNEGFALKPSEDYQGEFVLEMNDAGNGSMRVNLDVGDLAALRAALPGRQEATADEVRDFLIGLQSAAGDVAHQDAEAVERVIAMLERG
jgi:hypothetical protein